MQTEQALQYRYPGTKPFEAMDYALFKGRDEDILKLFDLILLENPIVLFGRSGLGKSSLLNAGLYHKIINKQEATPLFIRFGAYYKNTPIIPLEKLSEAIAQEITPTQQHPLFEKLAPHINGQQHALWYQFKKIQINEPAKNSFVLIFDQFEELFTYPQHAIDQFKKELAELIYIKVPQELRDLINEKRKTNPSFISKEEANLIFAPLDIRILFSIRSDKLSLLNSLRDYFPTVLKNCYELKPLSRVQAQQAIEFPSQLTDDHFKSKPFDFEDELLQNILNTLTKKNNQDAIKATTEESEIETFQLQIVCKFVESLVIEKELKIVTVKEIKNIAEIFENHYKAIVNKLPTSQRLPACIMMEEKLIVEKTRVSMPEISLLRDVKEKGLTRELIDALINTHIIRRDQNGTVEISHDTLIEPILKYYEERKRSVRNKRNRLIVTIAGIFVIIILCAAFGNAIIQSSEAKRLKKIADENSLKANKQIDSAKLLQQQADSSLTILNKSLILSTDENSTDTNSLHSSPSVIALSRAYNEYKTNGKDVQLRTNRSPFFKKYLQAANAADDSDWNVAFVIWCFTNSPYMRSKFADFTDAKYPANFLKQLAQKGYVVNDVPEKQLPGDIVFFDFGEKKGAQTCGIVFSIDVNKGFVYSIEGNIDGKVQTKVRYLGDVESYARIPEARLYLLAGNMRQTTGFGVLQNQLTVAGFYVMGAKYLNDNGRPNNPEIRYFNDSDLEDATILAKFMESKAVGQHYVAKKYPASTAKPGYIEIWLGR